MFSGQTEDRNDRYRIHYIIIFNIDADMPKTLINEYYNNVMSIAYRYLGIYLNYIFCEFKIITASHPPHQLLLPILLLYHRHYYNTISSIEAIKVCRDRPWVRPRRYSDARQQCGVLARAWW